MEFVDRIRNYLSRPFPEYESLLSYLKTVIAISVFITVFLYQFQPNGLASVESNKFLICIGFGLICFLSCVSYEFLLIKILKVKGKGQNHTFGKWIVEVLGLILTISFFNFLYARILFFGYVDWRMLPAMIYGTMSIGIFPIAALGALALSKQERKYLSIAKELNSSPQREATHQTSQQSIFDIDLGQIRYVESLQNYIKIGYLDSSGVLQQHTERATLKVIEGQLEGTPIVRCHRSYLVNRQVIDSVSGNAQGLLLTLSNCEKEVPVSRSYVDRFRS